MYLKCAEIITEDTCEIYEITDSKSDRKSYKIFPNKQELKEYLSKNEKKKCKSMEPLYISKKYTPVQGEQIEYLNKDEVNRYIKLRKSKK